ncbi:MULTISPECIES: TRAP transporter small permease [Halocynthiibacter]|uniref:TRAP transporter small permease protein n=1 Tax=Halocynthiibacter halioticoli TaxID=2986804 RepID=A0AAE3IYG1_9RHOB|nr:MULTISPECIES: TRAP transporter small permease [Halocynthiibacter]MCV6823430.1 TRAP transporter small permease [Halocynthiibacter halioticoli]MCW4056431.1 TRAP transporter small permease [Halocynthiibacter sp. SDUM655004]MDE0590603.1 TRAP transporter small permease [Halocynthiibacter sp. C4]
MDQSEKDPQDAQPARPEITFADNEVDVSDFGLMDIPGLIALWGLSAIVFIQFFTRYVLNDSLAWTEEIARYVLIIVAYFGAISVTRKGTHIFLEFFYRYLSPRAGKYLAVAMEALSMVFYGYLAYLGWILAAKTRTKMASIAIPKNILYYAIAIALAIMTVYSLYWLIRKIRQSPDDVLREIEEHALHEIHEEISSNK